jgi:hypothetical protein
MAADEHVGAAGRARAGRRGGAAAGRAGAVGGYEPKLERYAETIAPPA